MSRRKPKKPDPAPSLAYSVFDGLGSIVGFMIGLPIGLFFLFWRVLFKAAVLALLFSFGGLVVFCIACFMIICGAYEQEA